MTTKTHAEKIYNLQIEKNVYPGKGLAHACGQTIFVHGAVAGEVITARIIKTTRKFAEAIPVEITSASPNRINVDCPVALSPSEKCTCEMNYCPGCSYRHVDYNHEIAIKQSHFISFLTQNIKDFSADLCGKPVPSPSCNFYRNKIVLHTAKGNEYYYLGYYGPDNKKIICIKECPLAMRCINEKIKHIYDNRRTFFKDVSLPLRVVLRASGNDSVIVWKGTKPVTETIINETISSGTIKVPAGSFFQVNPPLLNLLLSEFAGNIHTHNIDTAVDIYGGVGIFGLTAALNGAKRIIISDVDKTAIKYANINASSFGIQNITTIASSAEQLTKKFLNNVKKETTLLILDPPRSGLSQKVIKAILANPPFFICYISCAPDTLGRDLSILTKSHYEIISARLFDMFPRTPYFESMSWLKLKERSITVTVK